MASSNFKDATLIPFFNEIFEKEKWIRMNWVNSQSESLQRATVLNREPTNYTKRAIKESVMAAGMATLTRDHIVASRNRRISHPQNLVKSGEVKKLVPAMKPVPDELKEVFYTDCRKAYLKKRNLLPPDKKYNFIECASWNHGWDFEQSGIKLRGPVHGKIFHFLRMRGLGPQPDPPYYHGCQEINNICIDMNY